jgi:TRAP-type C4-dicarboxylate transport system substrate-binding protein
MQDFQQRVVDEHSELNARTDKLDAFVSGKLFATLPPDEQERLRKQLSAMCTYREILRQRIAAFT